MNSSYFSCVYTHAHTHTHTHTHNLYLYITIFVTYKLSLLLSLFEKEHARARESTCTHEWGRAEREGERENPKQTPHCQRVKPSVEFKLTNP